MLVGYVRHIKAWPGKRQEPLLIAAGVKERYIYRDDEWEDCVVALRPGDKLVVGGLLRALGDNRRDIKARIDQVRGKGAVVMDAETGRIAGKDDGVGLLADTLAKIHGEAVMQSPEQAREMQAKSVKSRTKNRMSKRQALVYWRDPKLTWQEACAITGWSRSASYIHLGDRLMPRGPRPGRKQ